jgi:DNA-binding MarR family transcriptional regulator
MNDIFVPPDGQFRDDAFVRGGMDLLMLTHKSHLQRADDELAFLGLGRAEHRVLYIVARRPGLMVSELIDILQITKQSAQRPVIDLVTRGFLTRDICSTDRRRRLLYLTDEGAALEKRLAADLWANMDRAYAEAGEDAVRGFWSVMQHLMTPRVRDQFRAFHEAKAPPAR